MEFYRVDEIQYEDGPRLYVRRLYLVRETPCGHWISDDRNYTEAVDEIRAAWAPRKRWISKTSRKRFAYPTIAAALVNFRARKHRQILILKNRLDRAQTALVEATRKDIENKLQRDLH